MIGVGLGRQGKEEIREIREDVYREISRSWTYGREKDERNY